MLTKFKDITTFIFDVDGVLTDGSVFVNDMGEQTRLFNIKDGYALQLAVKCGYNVCAISGSRSKIAIHRLNSLGIKDVFLGSGVKTETFKVYINERGISPMNVLYMGDDIPDLEVMQLAGLPCCPLDAVQEIKEISLYISHLKGGEGCGRDVIEKVMKLRGDWSNDTAVRSK